MFVSQDQQAVRSHAGDHRRPARSLRLPPLRGRRNRQLWPLPNPQQGPVRLGRGILEMPRCGQPLLRKVGKGERRRTSRRCRCQGRHPLLGRLSSLRRSCRHRWCHHPHQSFHLHPHRQRRPLCRGPLPQQHRSLRQCRVLPLRCLFHHLRRCMHRRLSQGRRRKPPLLPLGSSRDSGGRGRRRASVVEPLRPSTRALTSVQSCLTMPPRGSLPSDSGKRFGCCGR